MQVYLSVGLPSLLPCLPNDSVLPACLSVSHHDHQSAIMPSCLPYMFADLLACLSVWCSVDQSVSHPAHREAFFDILATQSVCWSSYLSDGLPSCLPVSLSTILNNLPVCLHPVYLSLGLPFCLHISLSAIMTTQSVCNPEKPSICFQSRTVVGLSDILNTL